MIYRIAIALIALLPTLLRAQADPLVEAYRHYQAGEIGKARQYADEAVGSAAHANDPEAWLLHGFIYKDLFKSASPGSEADSLRNVSDESLYRSVELDEKGIYQENPRQAYEYMGRTFYNEAARELNDMAPERAESLFLSYKETIRRLDPGADLRQRE